MLTLSGYYLLTHKVGDKASDCQDAICLDQKVGVIAVADGATQSFFAKTWAEGLVREYVSLRITGAFDQSAWLSEAQQKWLAGVKEIAEGTGDIFLINSLNGQDPAYSTFLGIRYVPQTEKQTTLMVEAEAIGDSCLLHFSRGKLLRAFPIETSKMFSNQTLALSSRQAIDSVELAKLRLAVSEGDQIVLATDAFARFLLQVSEETSPMLSEFLALTEKSEVQEFVSRQRRGTTFRLENDDIALASLNCRYSQGLIEDFSFSTIPAEPSRNSVRAHTMRSQSGRPQRCATVLSNPVSDDAGRQASSTSLSRVLRFAGGALFAVLWLATIVALTTGYFKLRTLEKDMSSLTSQISSISNRMAGLERKLQMEAQQEAGSVEGRPADSAVPSTIAKGKNVEGRHGQ